MLRERGDARLCFSLSGKERFFSFCLMKLSSFEKTYMIIWQKQYKESELENKQISFTFAKFGLDLIVLFHLCQASGTVPVTMPLRNSLKSLTLQVKQRIIDVDTKNSLGDCLRFAYNVFLF